MNRVLLSITFLSGLVFLVCLVQNSGSNTYYHFVPYPNERTQFPSGAQLVLMSIHDNPWIGVSVVSGVVFSVSLLTAAILVIFRKLSAHSPA